jgi:hypothetical protein
MRKNRGVFISLTTTLPARASSENLILPNPEVAVRHNLIAFSYALLYIFKHFQLTSPPFPSFSFS